MKSRITMLLVVAAAATFGTTAVAHAAGELTQKPGLAGCISEDTAKGECLDGKGLQGPYSVAVSPDGKHAYVASGDSEGVAVLDRDRTTGALTQGTDATACLTKDGNGNTCEAVQSLAGARDVAVSPDGRNVYVAGHPGGVTIFDRDAGDGTLDRKAGKAGCISSDGSGDTCEKGTAVAGASAVVVSPDGRSVYVLAYNAKAVAIFDRDTSTGVLTQKPGKAGCLAEVGGEACNDGRALGAPVQIAVSPDGRNVYTTSDNVLEALDGSGAGAIAILARDPATGALTQDPGRAGCISYGGSEGACHSTGIDGFYGVAVSPDGRSAYVTVVRDGAIAHFDREPASGALTQKPGVAVGGGASEIVVSPDGRNVYGALPELGTVAVLDRAATGALTLRSGAAGCVSETGSAGGCQDGRGLAGVYGITVSPDGRNVYGASYLSNAIAVFDRAQPAPATPQQADRLAPTVSRFSLSPRRLRAGRRARVRFTLSEPAAVRIVLERMRPGRRVVRTLRLDGRAGVNTVRLRVRGRGRYRVTITATDAAGNRSAPKRAGLRIVRRPAR